MADTPADSPAPVAIGVKSNELPMDPFRPALIVVDMQNDFCPPDGSLPVPEARAIIPLINSLITSPGFVLKIATQDWHPPTHISFAPNHAPPNNKPCTSEVDMTNPMFGKIPIDVPNNALKTIETKKQLLWPVHCVQHSPGAAFADDLNYAACDVIVRKGMDPRVEMYSVFADAFGNMDCVSTGGVSHDVVKLLKEAEVSDVFVVGVAGDFCVKCTALDSASAGFRTWVIEEATRLVDATRWDEVRSELRHGGVSMISLSSEKMREVRETRGVR